LTEKRKKSLGNPSESTEETGDAIMKKDKESERNNNLK
jgi:hypothetical protein